MVYCCTVGVWSETRLAITHACCCVAQPVTLLHYSHYTSSVARTALPGKGKALSADVSSQAHAQHHYLGGSYSHLSFWLQLRGTM
jgi:hypothetical protein